MSNPRTVAVDMPPDDAGEESGAPVAVSVAVPVPDDVREPVRRSGARLARSGAGAGVSDPALAAQLAARKSERMAARTVTDAPPMRANSAARVTVAASAQTVAPVVPEPDIPQEQLPPGALVDMLVDTSQVTPESLPETERVAWERRQAASGRAADDAPVTVADAVPALRRLLADPNISAADAASLVLALSRVSDAARDAPSARPLCELTHAELCERVTECDTRRAQLLAAIAAAGGATPGGGGDSRRA